MITNSPIKTKWLCEKCLIYPQLKTIVNDMNGYISYLVECPKCLCHTGYYETPDEAKAAWDDKTKRFLVRDEEEKKPMKEPMFGTIRKSFWETTKETVAMVFSFISNCFLVTCAVLLVCAVLYACLYQAPKELIKSYKESQKVLVERKEEQRKPLPIHYEEGKFHKVILEGHEYWYAENFKNNVGFCHSESCPCKTNKTGD